MPLRILLIVNTPMFSVCVYVCVCTCCIFVTFSVCVYMCVRSFVHFVSVVYVRVFGCSRNIFGDWISGLSSLIRVELVEGRQLGASSISIVRSGSRSAHRHLYGENSNLTKCPAVYLSTKLVITRLEEGISLFR